MEQTHIQSNNKIQLYVEDEIFKIKWLRKMAINRYLTHILLTINQKQNLGLLG